MKTSSRAPTRSAAVVKPSKWAPSARGSETNSPPGPRGRCSGGSVSTLSTAPVCTWPANTETHGSQTPEPW